MQNFIAMVGIALMVLGILVLLFNLFVVITNAIWKSSYFYSIETTDLFVVTILSFLMGIVVVAMSSVVGG